MYIIYVLDTKSIEDANQCVLIDAPDWECDSIEALESWLEDHSHEGLPIANVIEVVNLSNHLRQLNDEEGLDNEN
jgi:hypothetical protein